MNCRACGAQNQPDAQFCHKCGMPLTELVCPNCKKRLTANDVFCPGCGINTSWGQPLEPPVDDQERKPEKTEKEQAIFIKVREYGMSPLFLASIILFSVALLFSIFGASSLFQSYFEGADPSVRSIVNSLDQQFSISQNLTIISIILSTPTIIAIIGFWILYAEMCSTNSNPRGMGISWLKASVWVNLVYSIIEGLGCLLLWIMIGSEVRGSYGSIYNDIVMKTFNLYFIIILVALGIKIAMIIKAGEAVESIRSAYVYHHFDRPGTFLGVMLFVTGGSNAISSFLSMSSNALWFTVSNAAAAAAYIIFGILLFRYREDITWAVYH